MSAPGTGSSLAALGSAVAASKPRQAIEAALAALKAKIPPLEVIRPAAVAGATHYDVSSGVPPRGLALAASAAQLVSLASPSSHAMPVLQAIQYLASEPRSRAPSRVSMVVAGEPAHLARSFLFAVRAGDLAEAEPIFLGMVTEGRGRTLAGDILFRAALEDMGEGGRKLFLAVRSWQLARALGFKDARALLRPAVQYLVTGPRDRTAFDTIMRVLGREWVDLETLGAGGRPLDQAGRSKVASLARAERSEGCVAATLALLQEGFAAGSIAEGLVAEAARRVLLAPGFNLESARGLLFAHAARFVLHFSRTSERLYALLQAALRIRSPAPEVATTRVDASPRPEEALRRLDAALEARKPLEAAGLVRAYVDRGEPADGLLRILVDHASRDTCAANQGINLLLADAAVVEFRASGAAEVPMALAKIVASSPKDTGGFELWRRVLAP